MLFKFLFGIWRLGTSFPWSCCFCHLTLVFTVRRLSKLVTVCLLSSYDCILFGMTVKGINNFIFMVIFEVESSSASDELHWRYFPSFSLTFHASLQLLKGFAWKFPLILISFCSSIPSFQTNLDTAVVVEEERLGTIMKFFIMDSQLRKPEQFLFNKNIINFLLLNCTYIWILCVFSIQLVEAHDLSSL